MNRVLVVGGGAAGFFAAINAKEMNPNLEIIILEKGKEVLQKVKISGGGRCNVTHACFEPKELVKFYPRGEKELLGPFHQFMTGDTFEWFDTNGIPLKIESDNRVFPESNSSQTIIDCFLKKTKELDISVLKNHGVTSIVKENDQWLVNTKEQQFVCDFLIIAAGSSKQVWKLSKSLGHSIVDPVPSLFTFNIKDARIKDLLGLSVPHATVKLKSTHQSVGQAQLEAFGPLLITHWGMSGPAVLKLSAFGARILAAMNYEYQVEVNWISQSTAETLEELQQIKKEQSRKQVVLKSPFSEIPRRLWERLVLASQIKPSQNWADVSKIQLQNLSEQLTKAVFQAKGKSTFKEEFVTAGGVELKEINFKRFESKLHNNLFFIGEVLNIDAVTGGFNFQNAWTGGYVVAKSIAEN
jgi:predicted Rossmann fold flavoprotein